MASYRVTSVVALVGFSLPLEVIQAQQQPETVAPKCSSFINEPAIVGGRLERAKAEWRIPVEAKFMNDCLAKAGVVAESITLPLRSSDERPSLTVLTLRQRLKPDGCPDIFMPVTKRFDVVIRPTSTVETIVCLNTAGAFSNQVGVARIHTFDVLKTPSSDVLGVDEKIQAEEISLKDYVPVVDKVSLKTSSKSAQVDRFTLELEVVAPSTMHLAKGIVVRIIESPADDMKGDGGPVNYWVLVYSPEGGKCTAKDPQPVRRQYSISDEMLKRPQRKLVLLNRVANGKETKEQPFTVLEVR